MSEVKVGKNETIDSALRRFKRTCQKLVLWLRSENANIMKNLVSNARRKVRSCA